MEKLYSITRSDLPAGLQGAQALHALQAMNDQQKPTIKAWKGNIAWLSARDQKHLSELMCRLQRAEFPIATFCEPDEGGELTALAVHGDAWKLLSSLPKALKDCGPDLIRD